MVSELRIIYFSSKFQFKLKNILNMFKNVSDNGFLTVLNSSGKRPLSLWEKKVRTGHIRRVTDNELQSLVLELVGTKMKNSYITCPGDIRKTLGVKFPNLVVTVKNLRKVFAFDVQILDENNVRRRFKVSTFTANLEIKPFICKVPLFLEEGWNQIVIPLQEFTKKVYDTNYKETLRIQIYSNCRIQRVFFTNKVFNEEDLMAEWFVCIFHSINKQSLHMWEKKIRNGTIKKVKDEDLLSSVLEISAPKIAATYITCPRDSSQILGIKNAVLNMTVKNLNKHFAFDIQVADDRNVKRRFRASTYQTVAEVKPYCCRLPLTLEEGWNQITFPLHDFTTRCYGTNFAEILRLQIYASCRLRRVFFSNKICQEAELPLEFRLNHLAIPKRVSQKFSDEKLKKEVDGKLRFKA